MDLTGIGNQLAQIIQGNTTNSNGQPKTFWGFISSPQFYMSVVVVIIAVAAWILLKKVSRHYNKKIAESDADFKARSQRRTIAHMMTSVLKVVIILGAVISFLQIQGYNVSTLVAGIGVLSAIIGFALQDAIKDVIGGMYIMADHYFEVGDVIAYGGDEGEVTRMSIRSTTIKSVINGNTITISNRSFSEAHKVASWWDIDMGLSYDDPSERINSVLNSICEEISALPKMEKCEYKGINEFAESDIVYKIRCFSNPINKYELKRASLRLIQKRFEEEGISIPYNYLNVVVSQKDDAKGEKE